MFDKSENKWTLYKSSLKYRVFFFSSWDNTKQAMFLIARSNFLVILNQLSEHSSNKPENPEALY